ncbi:Hemicentin-1,Coadhesin,Thrombospondin-2,Thrombospondin-1,Mucin-like protein,Adhesion G protein-coupled receptor B1 [Mytilus edulis]|uniref:Hemicentin-1,Coadhesin,Thrombospondin-2,Thrombosp ondin-1,Mucin-like protein,Adhesion G protein-coupled receptor B1 n=1 Tax=Mytilus edulis TaxID=6550 RepID=A0A8S3QPU8_MYTED|nr:Hemicentin-1,Coadhesin,Thrombospondin-2,Thrombospondin-1,Mucin-like protein,Adhesion G protein-coupled receptor B1 [Mytilus edulis]
MLYTVEFMLMFSLSTIHLARAQGCPNMCTCSGTTVDCSNKGLTQIPDDIPSTTTTLYLVRNSITSIEENVFVGLTSLRVLFIESFPIDKRDVHSCRSLSSNIITSVEERAFEGLTSLQTLFIEFFPIDKRDVHSCRFLSGNIITSVEERAFEGLTSLQTLYMNNNPLVCCSVTGFVDWVNRRSLDQFRGTCTAHNNTTAILNFNTSDCIVPVDGGWSDWENSTCSVTCGDGTVNMNRECNNPVPSGGGHNCSGEPIDTDSCNLGECPEYDFKVNSVFFYIQTVDGGWSDWENSTCSVTCGDGTVNMNRECNNPVPSGGGNNCSGKSINTDSCNLGECPVDGGWSDWENSTCSVTCGDGTVTMNRECNTPVPSGGGNNCSGKSINTDSCNLGECPVDGGWSDWENSTCSVTCGDGTVNMNRECNNPVPSGGGNNCSGKSINTDSCNLGECPVDGGWSDWENSTCSVTCGDGTVNMNRECNNPVPSGGGHNCSGEPIDTDSCNLGVCPESCNTLEKELDKKSGKRSDNKSGKWSENKSGKWSDNKSGNT